MNKMLLTSATAILILTGCEQANHPQQTTQITPETATDQSISRSSGPAVATQQEIVKAPEENRQAEKNAKAAEILHAVAVDRLYSDSKATVTNDNPEQQPAKTVVETSDQVIETAKQTESAKITETLITTERTQSLKQEPETTKAAASSLAKRQPASEVKETVTVVTSAEPVPEVVALGNATRGESLSKKCKACHHLDSDRKKVGPGLKTVVGRKAGSMSDMKYSSALASADWVWDDQHLAEWLCDTKKAITELSGNPAATSKMPSQNICGEKAIDLIAYLKSNK